MTKVTEDFMKAFELLIGNEGGYSNNPHDPGGETMWGVTKRVAVQCGYTGAMKSLPLATAQMIAKTHYWDPFWCDELPLPIAFQMLDTSYNGGHPIAWLQYALGLPVDGKMSGMVVKVAQTAELNPWKVLAKFNAQRLRYLASLKQPTFADGRMNRIANNLEKGTL